MFEGARTKLARFIGAPDPSTVVFTRGTTESINLVANAWGAEVPPRGRRDPASARWSTTRTSSPGSSSPRRPGASLRFVPIEDDGTPRPVKDSRRCSPSGPRSSRSPGSRTSLGTMPPIATARRRRARRRGDRGRRRRPARPAHPGRRAPSSDVRLPHDLAATRCSGPTASGGLYGRLELLEAMDPFLGGGEMIMEVYPDHSTFKAAAAQVRGGDDEHRRGDRRSPRRSTTSRPSGWTTSGATSGSSRPTRSRRCGSVGATVFGPKDPSIRGGAVSLLVQGHPPARPGARCSIRRGCACGPDTTAPRS